MTRNIPGSLDWRALAAPMAYDQKAQHHFHAMPHDQQRQAINRLAVAGHSDDVIARATGLVDRDGEAHRRRAGDRMSQPDRFEIEDIDHLPAKHRSWVPPLVERQSLSVGECARLAVLVDGDHYLFPWVEVIEVNSLGYVGEVGGILNSPDWLPPGTRVQFTANHVIGV